MKRTLAVISLLLLSCGIFYHPAEASSANTYAVTAAILDSAESFFISLQNKHFKAAWNQLSEESKKTLVNNIYKAAKDSGTPPEKSVIKRDFETSGPVAREYWQAFLTEFDPDMVLEESRWEMGPIEKNSAEIFILHKKSERPAILKMYRENGAWKFGFWETFGARRR